VPPDLSVPHYQRYSTQHICGWGWRVPFALGLVIVPVGLYIRRRLPETLERRDRVAAQPYWDCSGINIVGC